MTEQQHAGRPRIFYGWWIVLAAVICVTQGVIPIIILTLGQFMIPLEQEFGWGRGDISLAFTVIALTLALAMPIMGKLLDRFGPRPVLLWSIPVYGIGVMSLYFLTDSLWHFLGMFMVLGICGAGTNTMAYIRVLSAWFDRHRGMVIGLAAAGIGLGHGISAPVSQLLMDSYGWRGAYVGLGLIPLLVAWPLVFFVIRETPQEMGLSPDGEAGAVKPRVAAAAMPGVSRVEALRSREFIVLFAIILLTGIALSSVQVHIVPLLQDNGLTPQAAAMAAALVGIANVFAKATVGRLFDFFFAPRVAVFVFLCHMAAVLLLSSADTMGLAIFCAVLIGFGGGAESDLIGYLTGRYFGLRAFGELYGYIYAALMLGTAIGPYAMGLLYDATGTYQTSLWFSAAGVVVIIILLFQFRPYPKLEEKAA